MSESADYVFAVQPGDVHRVWSSCWRFIAAALARSRSSMTPTDVLRRLIDGRAQLWCAERSGDIVACLVSEVEGEPPRKQLNVWLLAGDDMSQWSHGLERDIEPWARSIGCSAIRMTGRRGWGRVLRDWREVAITLEKSLV